MQFVLTKPKIIQVVPRPECGLQLAVMPIARIASATVWGLSQPLPAG
jgi:hypothetical protein